MKLNGKELSKYMDHTMLQADASKDDILKVISEAKEYDTASVCVNSYWADLVHENLKDTDIKAVCVVGFPLGAMSTKAKVYEAKISMDDGADEIDMVLNIGELKQGNTEAVVQDISAVAKEVHQNSKILKVIIENALLTESEKKTAVKLTIDGKADFVKTSTGFSTSGATVEDVKLMRKTAGNKIQIKAAGGIHSLDDAVNLINAGADRLGVSGSVKILEEAKASD